MQWTDDHRALADTVKKFVASELNPHMDEWEAAREFPSHSVFKKLGNLGLLGINYPEKYGGLALDYSYSVAMAEALGSCDGGGVPMAIGVQTDMCTPALARFGSDALREEFLAPSIAGTWWVAWVSPNPKRAAMWPASRPPRRKTAMTTSSTVPRCGSPTPES